jgi:hypothetical protein
MGLFVGSIVTFAVLTMPLSQNRSAAECGDIDLIQLTHKIQNGELKQLTVRRDRILARDSVRDCEYETRVTSESTRAEILRAARELDSNGRPRVARIDEETTQAPPPAVVAGLVALFAVHIITMILILALIALYIILALKSDHLDQTTRIVWVLLLYMLNMFVMPVYWYLYIWRAAPANPAGGVARLAGDVTSASS